MSEQAKVYAKSATTVFYDLNKNLITKLHAPKEWNPFDLNQSWHYQSKGRRPLATGLWLTSRFDYYGSIE